MVPSQLTLYRRHIGDLQTLSECLSTRARQQLEHRHSSSPEASACGTTELIFSRAYLVPACGYVYNPFGPNIHHAVLISRKQTSPPAVLDPQRPLDVRSRHDDRLCLHHGAPKHNHRRVRIQHHKSYSSTTFESAPSLGPGLTGQAAKLTSDI